MQREPYRYAQSEALYAACVEELTQRGEATQANLELIDDLCFWQDVKLDARNAIRKGGNLVDFTQGRQHLKVENKNMGILQKANDAQRKILRELRMTPAASKRQGGAEDDADDPFERI